MNAVKVKICGLTRLEDVTVSVKSGADMLGFVFADSPRKIGISTATELSENVPDGILKVGLFMDNNREVIQDVLQAVSLDLIQFHGRESAEFCGSFGLPYIKAIAMGDPNRVVDAAAMFPEAAGHLYDSHQSGGAGGSGTTFDWSLLQKGAHFTWLAGGLNPGNVAQAIRRVKPFAVDVSSGVEDSPGIKNADLIKSFISTAKSVLID
jgi:phosphoribosylanthranilate isomerase